ncbi:hypothetical protein AAF712_008435 [Marasmius tenuissimus]|uniref:F-box domain-containing protein n=1 Tax=Marasmius tenuissimus TaxID=585030 RepID=A0ABR2ZTY1_9AGAR
MTKDRLLDIHIKISPVPFLVQTELQFLIDILRAESHRWRSLNLWLWSQNCTEWNILPMSKYANLERVELHNVRHPKWQDFLNILEETPVVLRRLAIHPFSEIELPIPNPENGIRASYKIARWWNKIAYMQIEAPLDMDLLSTALSYTRHLYTLVLVDGSPFRTVVPPHQDSTDIEINSLRNLHVHLREYTAGGDIFGMVPGAGLISRLKLPNLQHLGIHDLHWSRTSNSRLACLGNMLRRSFCVLVSLTLDGIAVVDTRLTRFLRRREFRFLERLEVGGQPFSCIFECLAGDERFLGELERFDVRLDEGVVPIESIERFLDSRSGGNAKLDVVNLHLCSDGLGELDLEVLGMIRRLERPKVTIYVSERRAAETRAEVRTTRRLGRMLSTVLSDSKMTQPPMIEIKSEIQVVLQILLEIERRFILVSFTDEELTRELTEIDKGRWDLEEIRVSD